MQFAQLLSYTYLLSQHISWYSVLFSIVYIQYYHERNLERGMFILLLVTGDKIVTSSQVNQANRNNHVSDIYVNNAT